MCAQDIIAPSPVAAVPTSETHLSNLSRLLSYLCTATPPDNHGAVRFLCPVFVPCTTSLKCAPPVSAPSTALAAHTPNSNCGENED
jgi:hypothetical protein